MLGGVALDDIIGLTILSLVMAAFGCALALAVSVRSRKTHEVLMAVYAVWGVVILGLFIWDVFFQVTGFLAGRLTGSTGLTPITLCSKVPGRSNWPS